MNRLTSQMSEISLLESFQQQYPDLTLKLFPDNHITVRWSRYYPKLAFKDYEGNWVVDEKVRAKLPDFVLFVTIENRLLEINSNYYGAYLVVNSEFLWELYDAEGDALRAKASEDSLVGPIGDIGECIGPL